MAGPSGFFTDGLAETTQVHWLIDSGCTITILSLKKYQEIPKEECPELKRHKYVLVTADDKPLQVHGQTELNIKFGDQWIQHRVIIAEINNDGLIGMDFLMRHHVTIDFSTQKISFNGENVDVHCRASQYQACRVSIQEGTVIPAGT